MSHQIEQQLGRIADALEQIADQGRPITLPHHLADRLAEGIVDDQADELDEHLRSVARDAAGLGGQTDNPARVTVGRPGASTGELIADYLAQRAAISQGERLDAARYALALYADGFPPYPGHLEDALRGLARMFPDEVPEPSAVRLAIEALRHVDDQENDQRGDELAAA